jgi:hypothetical protein
VGSAYLFEKPQSREGKDPKLQGLADDDGYNGCDSTCYKPNTSRRRQPCSDYAEAVRDSCVGSTRLARGNKQDWENIWGLSCALIFEVLKLVLLMCLTSVRLGVAATVSVGEWLDEEGLALQSAGYKGGLRNACGNKKSDQDRFTDDATDFTNSKGPVQTRKQLRTSVECPADFQPTYQRPLAEMAGAAATPASSIGSLDP